MAITKATASSIAPAAKGDLVAGSATNDAAVLGVGANDTVLTADSSTATGLKWAAVSGGYSNYQLFTSSGTFTVPAGITKCAVYMVGGGGGGGSGRAQPSNFNVGGGAGGTGGIIGADSFYTVTPADVLTVTVGAGGAGGAANAITSNGANGSSGANGTASVFGSLIVAGGIGGEGGIIYGHTNSSTLPQLLTSNTILTKNNGFGGVSPESDAGQAGGPGTVVMLTQSGSLGTAGAAGSAGTNLGSGGTVTSTGFGGGGGGGGSCAGAAAIVGGAATHGGGGGGGNARSVGSVTTTSGAGGAGAVNRGGGGGGSGAAQKTATGETATSPAGGNGGSGFVAIFY
jgi:hypothetical protein